MRCAAMLALFCLLAPVLHAQEIEHAGLVAWVLAHRYCDEHPDYPKCAALQSRYAWVAPRVRSEEAAHPITTREAPSLEAVDRVMSATEHMAFDPSFGALEPETERTMPRP